MGSPFKMKPGSGSSAKHTGRGLAERGLVPDRGPKMHEGLCTKVKVLKWQQERVF